MALTTQFWLESSREYKPRTCFLLIIGWSCSAFTPTSVDKTGCKTSNNMVQWNKSKTYTTWSTFVVLVWRWLEKTQPKAKKWKGKHFDISGENPLRKKKPTIHQVTTMLATSENALLSGHNHLLTTNTDEVVSMVVTWWIVAFWAVIGTNWGNISMDNNIHMYCRPKSIKQIREKHQQRFSFFHPLMIWNLICYH